jgi:hypothetical protein
MRRTRFFIVPGDVRWHYTRETPQPGEQAAVKAVHACPASFRLELQATMQQIDCNDRVSIHLTPPVVRMASISLYTILRSSSHAHTSAMDSSTTAKDDKDLNQPRKRSSADEVVTDDRREPASVADVYILVGRTAQTQSELVRKGFARLMPAFTKHWAVRVRWTTGEDMVWQIFQADKEVLSPVCSDYARVRRHFTASYKVCQTHNSAPEVFDAGMSVREQA